VTRTASAGLLPFDAAPFIDTPEAEAILLTDAVESGDAAYLAHALGIVVRARGISRIAREAGISRPTVYKVLGGGGDPKLSTLFALLKALNLRLTVEAPKSDEAA
jgi:probable addiction module antidote protein